MFQSLYIAVNRKYFIVSDPSEFQNEDPAIIRSVGEASNSITLVGVSALAAASTESSVKQGTLLSKLKWEAFFDSNFTKENARNLLTCPPNNPDLPIVKGKIFNWLTGRTTSIKKDNRQYLLQQIDSSIRGMRPLESIASVKVYSDTMFSVFCVLFRVVIRGENFGSNMMDNVEVSFLDYWKDRDSEIGFLNLLKSILFVSKGLLAERNSFFLSKILAIMSLGNQNSWKKPNFIRQPVAHFQYWQKCLVYYMCITDQNGSWIENVDTTINNICRVLIDYSAILKAHDYERDTEYLSWSVNTDNSLNYSQVIFRNKILNLKTFKTLYYDYLARLNKCFKYLMCGFRYLKSFPTIIDDIGSVIPGYSFLSDPRNNKFQEELTRYQAYFNSRPLSDSQNWMQRTQEFWNYALVLIHIASGQPAREPELAETQNLFNLQSKQRNVYFYRNRIMLIQRYSKTDNLRGSNKEIVR
jgi:hypothetical protein